MKTPATGSSTSWGGLCRVPRLGPAFFALAALGSPGLNNFVGEILILLGTFAVVNRAVGGAGCCRFITAGRHLYAAPGAGGDLGLDN
ncbi:MAG: hypothetical protein R2864_07295 [Syntrophotaleaceae bacterium]